MIDSNDPEEIDRIIREGIPDPVGSFYRFSLAGSQLAAEEAADCRAGNAETGMASSDGQAAR